ncbi:MAG TPA: hypothetical protein VMW80_02360 [Candidatus Dormibacteraeota bacterium]|nr:hypothetical protein [Candidatus Dormibacteraeota bacterium]
MLHAVAFVVIGLVIGAIAIRKARAVAAIIRVAGGLIGSLAGGFISLAALGSQTSIGKYGSIVIAIVVAAIVAGIAAMVSNMAPVSGRG